MFCWSREAGPHPGRVRFPAKGTEFSTVNHSEKKFIWSEISLPPSLSEAPSDASKEDSWTDRLPRGGDSWGGSRGGVGGQLGARQMAKWISNPKMSWVSAVIRKTKSFLRRGEDPGYQICMPTTRRTQIHVNYPGTQQTETTALSLDVSRDTKGHCQH